MSKSRIACSAARCLCVAASASMIALIQLVPWATQCIEFCGLLPLVMLLVIVLWCSRPLLSYWRVVAVTTVASIGFVGTSALDHAATCSEPMCHGTNWVAYGGATLIVWFVVAGITCLVVAIRRFFWPQFASGQCQNCGYSLRGLLATRCPECGRVFVPPERWNPSFRW